MAQEYHNYMTIKGTEEQRRSFVSDAFRLSPQWRWDWVQIDFNALANVAGDAGKSKLDFYTRGFPHGLDELMRLHPEVELQGGFLDLSGEQWHHMTLKNNEVLEERDEPVQWLEMEKVSDTVIRLVPYLPLEDEALVFSTKEELEQAEREVGELDKEGELSPDKKEQ